MKKLTMIVRRIIIIITIISESVLFQACTNIGSPDNYLSKKSNSKADSLLVGLGDDVSQSVKNYREMDTSFVANVCDQVESQGGGWIIFFTIGNQNDRSGIRCHIKPIPKESLNLTLSHKIAQKRVLMAIKTKNRQIIQQFLCSVQQEIGSSKGEKGSKHTALNEFFKKCETMLNEPQFQNYHRYIFVYSDGIQSINSQDRPANYNFKTKAPFTLCICGWKSEEPCDRSNIVRFEDPQGFIDFIKTK